MSLKISFIVCAIVLASIFTIVKCCKPGEYENIPNVYDPSKFFCTTCATGSFCPDGMKKYICPDGFIAPQTGAIRCQRCDSSRSDIERIACLLPGSPKDIEELNYGWVVYANQTTFGFVTFEKSGILRFKQTETNAKPVTVYASRYTPIPNPANYEQVSKEINPTFYLNNPQYEENHSPKIMYFSITLPVGAFFKLEYSYPTRF